MSVRTVSKNFVFSATLSISGEIVSLYLSIVYDKAPSSNLVYQYGEGIGTTKSGMVCMLSHLEFW